MNFWSINDNVIMQHSLKMSFLRLVPFIIQQQSRKTPFRVVTAFAIASPRLFSTAMASTPITIDSAKLGKVVTRGPVNLTNFTDIESLPQLEAKGVKLVGVTFQTGEELKAFLTGNFWFGDLYLDTEKKTYDAVGTSGVWGAFALIKSLFSGLSPAFRARMKMVNGNSKEVTTVYSTMVAIDPSMFPFLSLFFFFFFFEFLLKKMLIRWEGSL
jgi:hypothetical protein